MENIITGPLVWMENIITGPLVWMENIITGPLVWMENIITGPLVWIKFAVHHVDTHSSGDVHTSLCYVNMEKHIISYW